MEPPAEIKLFHCKTISHWNILFHAEIILPATCYLLSSARISYWTECKDIRALLSLVNNFFKEKQLWFHLPNKTKANNAVSILISFLKHHISNAVIRCRSLRLIKQKPLTTMYIVDQKTCHFILNYNTPVVLSIFWFLNIFIHQAPGSINNLTNKINTQKTKNDVVM